MSPVKVLLSSLHKEQSKLSPEAIEQAWINESVKRLEAYHRGDMEAYSVDEIIKELEGDVVKSAF